MRYGNNDRRHADPLRDLLVIEAVATLVVCLKCEAKRRAAWQAAHDEKYDIPDEPRSAALSIDEESILRETKKWTPGDEAEAIRNKARLTGWRLWASGDTRLMRKVSDLVWDRIAKDHVGDDGSMMNWLDHWFGGIGEPTNDVWGV